MAKLPCLAPRLIYRTWQVNFPCKIAFELLNNPCSPTMTVALLLYKYALHLVYFTHSRHNFSFCLVNQSVPSKHGPARNTRPDNISANLLCTACIFIQFAHLKFTFQISVCTPRFAAYKYGCRLLFVFPFEAYSLLGCHNSQAWKIVFILPVQNHRQPNFLGGIFFLIHLWMKFYMICSRASLVYNSNTHFCINMVLF